MTNYIILLPPSESKNQGGNEEKPYRITENLEKYNYFKNLNSQREFIYDNLRETIQHSTLEEVEKIFELKNKKLHEAIENTYDLLNKETMPSIKRYTGVMFKAINYEKFNVKQKENFEKSTIFIDGMFGLLKPQDMIPEYKLKITSKINELNITNFWKNEVQNTLNKEFKNKIIIDILPQSHRKIIDKKKESYNCDQYIQISFCDKKNNKIKQAGHNSKQLKGELINYISQFENINRKDLENFTHKSGYFYSEELSNKEEIIYLNEN